MKKNLQDIPLKSFMLSLFNENKKILTKNDSPVISKLRKSAITNFEKLGFPSQKLEEWKNTNLNNALLKNYDCILSPEKEDVDIDKIFRCKVNDFETYLFTTLNGWYVYKKSQLTTLTSGTIVGSLAKAMEVYPEIFEKHYGKYADIKKSGLNALNTAFAQDGIFIYVPDGVEISKPIQIVNIINTEKNILSQPRNLIILGKNSKLTLIHCDDSITNNDSLINSVNEFFIDENATLDYYKLQNKDENSTIITTSYFFQNQNSNLTSNTIALNGGIIRNNSHVYFNGQNCNANVYGLYLMDRKQHIDNHVFIDHAKPNCFSNEVFKGIIDDEASAVFNGHILVRKNAQKTNALQSNKNILLTDSAKVNTKPFLEIYADDVKCSHGATVGQLDTEAMFYIQSRGICEKNARILLMYAFAAEVVNKISLKNLRERIDTMIVKRLKGELTICDQCVLHCKDERHIYFDIDISKI